MCELVFRKGRGYAFECKDHLTSFVISSTPTNVLKTYQSGSNSDSVPLKSNPSPPIPPASINAVLLNILIVLLILSCLAVLSLLGYCFFLYLNFKPRVSINIPEEQIIQENIPMEQNIQETNTLLPGTSENKQEVTSSKMTDQTKDQTKDSDQLDLSQFFTNKNKGVITYHLNNGSSLVAEI